jgi:hypothetical protein
MFGDGVSIQQFLNDVPSKYLVAIRISDLVLEKLTKEQFREFTNWDKQLPLLGFSRWHQVTRYADFPFCDKVFIIKTDEVVKPMLFGHALPYTAEAL